MQARSRSARTLLSCNPGLGCRTLYGQPGRTVLAHSASFFPYCQVESTKRSELAVQTRVHYPAERTPPLESRRWLAAWPQGVGTRCQSGKEKQGSRQQWVDPEVALVSHSSHVRRWQVGTRSCPPSSDLKGTGCPTRPTWSMEGLPRTSQSVNQTSLTMPKFEYRLNPMPPIGIRLDEARGDCPPKRDPSNMGLSQSLTYRLRESGTGLVNNCPMENPQAILPHTYFRNISMYWSLLS